MRCTVVFYLVVTIFGIVYSLPELCDIIGYSFKSAHCGKHDVKYAFDFIPPISQNISYIGLRWQPLKQLPYNAFRNLSSQRSVAGIWLEHCQISHVDAGALLNLHNLSAIELSHNDINQIDSKLFSDTKRIKEINLEYNKIEVVPNGLFQKLILLEEVHLEHNRIRQVDAFSFQNTPSLRQIYLNNNQIEFMSMLFKDKFDNLRTFWLYGNPWKCSCELAPLYEFAIQFEQFYKHELVCEKPPTLHGRKWSEISSDEFVCRSEQDDNIPVTVYNGTRCQQVDNGNPQSCSNQNWILYTILVAVLVCVAVVMIGVVLLLKRSFRGTNSRNMGSGLSLCVVQSSGSKRGFRINVNSPLWIT